MLSRSMSEIVDRVPELVLCADLAVASSRITIIRFLSKTQAMKVWDLLVPERKQLRL
jgi:hypothetical protein